MKGVRPADYPPPFSDADVIGAPTDAPDERIDVGILIVGGGPGGLACAVRLGQLLEEHPAVRERLGEVPVAVLEKGKQPGSHLLSGAVMNPRAIRKLFAGRPRDRGHADLRPGRARGRLPADERRVAAHPAAADDAEPRQLGRLGLRARPLPRGAGGGGRRDDPAGDCRSRSCSSSTAASSASARATRGAARTVSRSPNFEPGVDVTAAVTVLAEGTAGHLTTAAIDRFGLQGRNPQIWALGVKEVWKVPKPLRKIVHTMGWPLRKRARYGEFGGSWIYPMGDDHVSLGFVVGLEYADVELSAHDLLQEFKTHRLVRKILDGGERVAWGAKTITEGGLHSIPAKLNAPGLLLVGEGAGLVNVPRLKGVHYAIESGRLAAEAAFAALQRGEVAGRRGALDGYDEALRASYVWKDLTEVRNMRQAFDKGFFLGGALASAMTVTKGKLPPKDYGTHPNADTPLLRTGRAASYPAAGRHVHLRQALLRLRVRQPDARRPAEPHPRGDERPARRRGDVALDVPGAGLRGGRGGRRRHRRRCSSTRRTASSAARSAPRAGG